jgi:hypothetical protein
LFVLYVCSKSVHNVTHRVRYKKGPSVIWVWCSIKETSGIIGSEKSRDGFSRSSRAWQSDTQGHCCQYLPVSKRSSLPFNIFWRLRTYWELITELSLTRPEILQWYLWSTTKWSQQQSNSQHNTPLTSFSTPDPNC